MLVSSADCGAGAMHEMSCTWQFPTTSFTKYETLAEACMRALSDNYAIRTDRIRLLNGISAPQLVHVKYTDCDTRGRDYDATPAHQWVAMATLLQPTSDTQLNENEHNAICMLQRELESQKASNRDVNLEQEPELTPSVNAATQMMSIADADDFQHVTLDYDSTPLGTTSQNGVEALHEAQNTHLCLTLTSKDLQLPFDELNLARRHGNVAPLLTFGMALFPVGRAPAHQTVTLIDGGALLVATYRDKYRRRVLPIIAQPMQRRYPAGHDYPLLRLVRTP